MRRETVSGRRRQGGPHGLALLRYRPARDTRRPAASPSASGRTSSTARRPQPGGQAAAPQPSPLTGAPDLVREVEATTTLLFRYSAMTFNGHRFHYDFPYATEVEGYSGPRRPWADPGEPAVRTSPPRPWAAFPDLSLPRRIPDDRRPDLPGRRAQRRRRLRRGHPRRRRRRLHDGDGRPLIRACAGFRIVGIGVGT